MPDASSPHPSQAGDSLPLEFKQRIDQICDRFEAAWKSGQRPQIEPLIARSGGRPRTELLRELLALEFEYRARLGEHPSAAEYDARFPGDVALVREVLAKFASGQQPAGSASVAETVDWSGTINEHGKTGAQAAAPAQDSAAAANKMFGRFRVLKLLGRGAFGSVYKAHDPQLDRNVALKIPHAGTIGTDEDAARFFREARAAGQLHHPYIVPVFDAGRVGTTYYIASAYIEGVPLRRAMQEGRFGNPREAAELVRKLATALNYAHEQKIVHRDVKPENILIDAAGNPHVLDFGLARRPEAEVTRTTDGAVLGTPVYMSPEQASGKSHLADGRSDLWSLGVVLYELLCGARPFAGAGTELYTAIVNRQPLAPRKRKPTLARDLETITLKCLAKLPGQRYPTCAALAEDLRRWQGLEPIVARQIGSVERFVRWCRRNPVIAGLAATAAGLLLAVAIVSLWANVQTSRALATADTERDRAKQALKKEAGERQRAEQALKEEARQRSRAEQSEEAALADQRRAQQNLYYANVHLAERNWLAGEIDDAERLLNDCPEALRHWEWHYLKRLCRRKITAGSSAVALDGHKSAVSVGFHPKGSRLASASADRTVVRDVASGREVLTLRGPAGGVHDVVFSGDGKWIASEAAENQVKIWDAASGQEKRTLGGHRTAALCVAYSPDGTRIAGGFNDGAVNAYDAATGKEINRGPRHPGPVRKVAFSADGTRIFSWSDWQLSAQNVLTGAPAGTLLNSSEGEQPYRDDAESFAQREAMSPDATRTASARAGQMVFVRNWAAKKMADARAFALKGHTGLVRSVVFSGDGKYLATGSDDRTVRLWDDKTGKEVRVLRGHAKAVESVAFSLDGTRLASVSADGTVKIWDVAADTELANLPGGEASPSDVAFSPDGKWLLCGSRTGEVRVHEIATGKEAFKVRTASGSVCSLAIRPDRAQIAVVTEGGQLTILEAATHRKLLTVAESQAEVLQLAFRPGGGQLATASDDSTVKLWDVGTGKESRTFAGHSGPVRSIAFAPDGNRMASGADDKTVRVWDVESGREIHRLVGHKGQVSSVAISRDGRLLASGSNDKTVRLWDAATVAPRMISYGHRETVACVAFSWDGKRMASASADRTVKLWDTETGQEVLTLSGHAAGVGSVAFSPDGRWLASGSADGALKTWDAMPGRELFVFRGDRGLAAPVWHVEFSGDGRQLFSATHHSNEIKIYDVATRRTMVSFRPKIDDDLSAAFSPDGTRIAGASEDNDVWVWDAATGQQLPSLRGHSERVHSVTFSPDSRRIASASQDHTVKIWDAAAATGLVTLRGHADGVWSVAFSSDGQAIAGGAYDGQVIVWDAQSGRELVKMAAHHGPISGVAFSPDGKRIATCGWMEGVVRVWQTANGKEELSLPQGSPPMTAAAGAAGEQPKNRNGLRWQRLEFSPDGTHIAACGSGGSTIWDSRDGKQAFRLPADSMDCVDFSPDGKWIATGASDGKVTIWDAAVGPQFDLGSAEAAVARKPVALQGAIKRIDQSEPPRSIAAHGLGGRDRLVAEKFPIAWKTPGDFAHITGSGAIEFPRIHTCRYVLETELTIFNHRDGKVEFKFADPGHGTELTLGAVWPEKDKALPLVPCRLFRIMPDEGIGWAGQADAPVERRLKLVLVVCDQHKALYYDGSRVLGVRSTPIDCRLRIIGEGSPDCVIHSCALRPLAPADTAALGWEPQPEKLALNIQATAERIRRQTGDLPSQPAESKPFLADSAGIPMRWVPAGEFTMGANTVPDPQGRGKHRVRLTRGFWIGQCEVTQEQWLKINHNNPSRFQGSPYLPVHWLSWKDAARFCQVVDARERQAGRVPAGYQYRLPSEAEWEYACTAGNEEASQGKPTNCWSETTSQGRPHEVGELPANRWGLYDMCGNVSEWCLDVWQPYPQDAAKALDDPLRLQKSSTDLLCIRGGGWWQGDLEELRPVSRDRSPSVAGDDRGFRIVLASQVLPVPDPAAARAIAADLPEPLARFPFDTDGSDEISGDRRFELKNTEFREGALYLNGHYEYDVDGGGYRALCQIPQMDYQHFTIAFRFKADDFKVEEHETKDGKKWSRTKNTLMSCGRGFRWFGLSRNNVNGNLVVSFNNSEFSREIALSDTPIAAGKWTVVACGVDLPARKVHIFLDRKLVAAIELPDGFKLAVVGTKDEQSEKSISFTNYGHGGTFQGLIDELVVYDRMLSDDELWFVPSSSPTDAGFTEPRAAAGPKTKDGQSQPLARFTFDRDGSDEISGDRQFQLKNTEFREGSLYLNGRYENDSDQTGGYRAEYQIPQWNYRQFAIAVRFKAEDFSEVKHENSDGKTWSRWNCTLISCGHGYRWFGLARNVASGNLMLTLNNSRLWREIPDTPITAGKWTVIACGVDLPARKVRVFVDRKPVADIELPADFKLDVVGTYAEERDKNIAFTDYGSGNTFHGLIDELVVYGRMLSDDELALVPPPK